MKKYFLCKSLKFRALIITVKYETWELYRKKRSIPVWYKLCLRSIALARALAPMLATRYTDNIHQLTLTSRPSHYVYLRSFIVYTLCIPLITKLLLKEIVFFPGIFRITGNELKYFLFPGFIIFGKSSNTSWRNTKINVYQCIWARVF